MQQIAYKLSRVAWLRQVQDQQGQGDREDAVEERVKSPWSQSSKLATHFVSWQELSYEHAGYDV